jgi:hypothetical protein
MAWDRRSVSLGTPISEAIARQGGADNEEGGRGVRSSRLVAAASRAETRLRENSHKIEALLTQKAGDAAASAKTAHDEADAVRKETDELTARLASAAKLLGLLNRMFASKALDGDCSKITELHSLTL